MKDYRCRKCGNIFTMHFLEPEDCPKCGSKNIVVLIAVTGEKWKIVRDTSFDKNGEEKGE